MKRGDLFDPINSKKEQLNYKNVESKIKGNVL